MFKQSFIYHDLNKLWWIFHHSLKVMVPQKLFHECKNKILLLCNFWCVNLQDLQCESSISHTYLYIWWHTKLLWMFPQPSPATKYYMCCSVSQQSTTDNLWQCNISNITPLHTVLSVHRALNFAEKVSARFSWYTSRTSYASPTCSILCCLCQSGAFRGW